MTVRIRLYYSPFDQSNVDWVNSADWNLPGPLSARGALRLGTLLGVSSN